MINVRRTAIEICPYNDSNRNSSLERSLSVYDADYHRLNPIALYYDVEKEKLIIPRSVSLRKLEQTFNEPINVDSKYDDFDKSIVKLKLQPRDDKQKEAISFLLGKEDYSNISQYSRLMLELDTGVGKTYCSVAAVAYMKVKGAIIVNTKGLMDQWIERITQYTNISKREIFVVSGSASVEKILSGKCDKYKLFIVSHKTINSYAKKNGWESITKVFEAMRIGVKIFDEAHLELKNIIWIDMFTNTRRTIYLTATAQRSSYIEDALYNTIYGPVPLLSIKREKKDAFVNSLVLSYKSLPSLQDLGFLKNRHGMNTNYFIKYSVFGKGNKYYFKCINVILNTVLVKDGQIAILVGLIAAAKEVATYISKNFPEYKDDIGIYTSEITDKKLRLKQLDKKIIITTFKSFGTGMDLKSLRYLVMAEPYSSKVTLQQVIGRLRDNGDESYYFELVDEGVKSRFNQFNSISKQLLKLSQKVTTYNVS